jgi:D-glycero-D-manno-heptose 1,7-bisphosphate phosphatase
MTSRPKRLAMFDLDGTLIEGHVARPDPDGPYVEVLPFAKVLPLPRRRERLAELRDEGLAIAICTNKGGVGFGHETEEECLDKAIEVLRTFELPNNVLYLQAFGHPHAKIEAYREDDPWRKPKPGMLYRAMERFGVDREDAFFVGDMEADEKAAAAAGVEFIHADVYFA